MQDLSSEGYLTDESDFYGSEEIKAELEDKVSSQDVEAYWTEPKTSLTALAIINRAAKAKDEANRKKTVLYEPFKARWDARQLEETVDEFLNRLPPATTPVSDLVPNGIWIANPFTSIDQPGKGRELVRRGYRLLEELTSIKTVIEKDAMGKSQAAVSRATNRARDETVEKLLDIAKELKCTTGQWMIFCDSEEVNALWEEVARATALNKLGSSAKVEADGGEARQPRLISVYTADFSDEEDVMRVLERLRDLKVVRKRARIYYKCDAFTNLQIKSGNMWNIRASLFCSDDSMRAKRTNDQEIDGFVSKKLKQ